VEASIQTETPEKPLATNRPPIRFNPFDKSFRKNPYPVYHQLRKEDPLHRTLGAWLLTRYTFVKAILNDIRFNSTLIPNIVKRECQKLDEPFEGIKGFVDKAIVFTENPDHDRLRKLVIPVFNKKSIEAERPMMIKIADKLLDKVMDQGHMDIISEYAAPLTLNILCERIQIPWEKRSTIEEWKHAIRNLLDPGLMTRKDYFHVETVLQQFTSLLADFIPQRSANPKSDFMSQILASRNGDDRLSDDEVLLLCIMTFVAGGETTQHLIGNGVNALLHCPDQLELLHHNPNLYQSAVTEIMRYESPLQQTKRYTTIDVDFNGKRFKKGDQILLCLGAANRDPAIFDQPDKFDITRQQNNHLSFGYGMHNCLGGTLAHAMAQIAFERLFARFSSITLKEEPEWLDQGVILRGLKSLNVTFIPKT